METKLPSRTSSIIAAIAIVTLIVVSGIFVAYYFQTQNTIQARNESINSLSGQITSDTTQISQIQSNVTSLQSQVSSDLTNIKVLQTQAENNASQIGELNSLISSDYSQIQSDNSQIASLSNQLPSLQSQLNQLTTIASLGSSTVELQSKFVEIPVGGQVTVTEFTAVYAGYISVRESSGTGIFSSGLGGGHIIGSGVSGIQVTETNGSRTELESGGSSGQVTHTVTNIFPNIILPGTGYFDIVNSTQPIYFPVIPGTIDVIFETSTPNIVTSAILTITYYY